MHSEVLSLLYLCSIFKVILNPVAVCVVQISASYSSCCQQLDLEYLLKSLTHKGVIAIYV